MSKMYYAYALVSERDGTLYIGHTQDVNARLREHISGKTRSTRLKRPYRLLHTEEFKTRGEAVAREKELKSGSGREFLKTLRTRFAIANTSYQKNTRL